MPLTGQSAHNNAIFDFTWNPGEANRLVTVSGDQRSRLWDLGQQQIIRSPHFFTEMEISKKKN
jgi:WD40 repeat protein